MLSKSFLTLFILLIVMSCFTYASSLMVLHGKAYDGNMLMNSGDLRVYIWNASSGGSLLYDSDSDFNGKISNGLFDVLLGSVTPLDLNFGQRYWYGLKVNGKDVNFGSGYREEFESVHGDLNYVLSGTGLVHAGDNISVLVNNSNYVTGSQLDLNLLNYYTRAQSDVNWGKYYLATNPNGYITAYYDTNCAVTNSCSSVLYQVDGNVWYAFKGDVNSWGDLRYYPLNSNPSGYITSYADTNFETAGLSLNDINNLWKALDGNIYNLNNGNIGIGTTNPTSKLKIVGTLTVEAPTTDYGIIKLKSDGAGYGGKIVDDTDRVLFKYGYDGVLGNYAQLSEPAEVATIKVTGIPSILLNGGNVGIGTTSPGYKLVVKSSSGAQSDIAIDNTDTMYSSLRFFRAGNQKWQVVNWGDDGDSLQIIPNGGNPQLKIYPTGNIVTNLNAGNFGIGTTSPTEKLEVNGNIWIYDNNKFCMGSGKDVCIDFNGIATHFNNEVGTGNWIFDNGNIGIGTTAPRDNLHIATSGSDYPGIILQDSDSNGIDALAYITAENSAAQQTWFLGDGWALYNNVRLQNTQSGGNLQLYTSDSAGIDVNAGNVGIGTTNPTQKLSVSATYDSYLNMNSGSNYDSGIIFTENSNNRWLISNTGGTADRLRFYAYGTTGVGDAMTILQDGNVGIGTTTPQNKLNVIGDTNITGNLHVDGNMSIKRPYGMFSSMKTQTIAATSTPYFMDFNTTEDNYLINKIADTNFKPMVSGDYLIEISIITQSTTPGSNIEIWVRKNNTDVPRSNTKYTFKSNGANTVISVPFIIDLLPTDTFSIMYASGDSTNITLPATPATAYSPETPSAIMTVTKISEITP